MRVELCTHCGYGIAEIIVAGADPNACTVAVACTACGARGGVVDPQDFDGVDGVRTHAAAIEMWNRRASDRLTHDCYRIECIEDARRMLMALDRMGFLSVADFGALFTDGEGDVYAKKFDARVVGLVSGRRYSMGGTG